MMVNGECEEGERRSCKDNLMKVDVSEVKEACDKDVLWCNFSAAEH